MSDKRLLEPTDLRYVFPVNKIRKEIKREEDIGKITKTAVELISACSASFVQRLINHATDKAKGDSSSLSNGNIITVTSDHIKDVISNDDKTYDFLLGSKEKTGEKNQDSSILCDLNETTAPRVRKRPKTNGLKTTFIKKTKNMHKSNEKSNIDSDKKATSTQEWVQTNREELGIVTGNNSMQKTISDAMTVNFTEDHLIEDTDEYD